MAELTDVCWPPDQIRTPRLLLRKGRDSDRHGAIELACSPVVRRYLGGPRDRSELEGDADTAWFGQVGQFAVECDGEFVGHVTFTRRDAARPGHLPADGADLELSYVFLPHVWGRGIAAEACLAALAWAEATLPDNHVVLCTQAANVSSVRLAQRLGFTHLETFEEFGAPQWFGARRLAGEATPRRTPGRP